jgi:hypothetical protein
MSGPLAHRFQPTRGACQGGTDRAPRAENTGGRCSAPGRRLVPVVVLAACPGGFDSLAVHAHSRTRGGRGRIPTGPISGTRPWSRCRLGDLFPYLPGQPGYHKRPRPAAASRSRDQPLGPGQPVVVDSLRLLDATPVPCAASRQTVRRSDLACTASTDSARRISAARPRPCLICRFGAVSCHLAVAGDTQTNVLALGLMRWSGLGGTLTSRRLGDALAGSVGMSGPNSGRQVQSRPGRRRPSAPHVRG